GFRPELRVTGLIGRDARLGDVEDFVLRRKARRVARRAARGPEPELVHEADMPERLGGNDPDARHAGERCPAVARARQRAAVPAVGAVEDVAVLVLEGAGAGEARLLDGQARRAVAEVGGRVAELENVLDQVDLTAAGAGDELFLVVVRRDPQLAVQVL